MVCRLPIDKVTLMVVFTLFKFCLIFILSSGETKSSEVFASPDREIRVINFTKEPGKLLGEAD